MINLIEFNGNLYPNFQASGFAARFIFPFAKEYCKGIGFDIGCNRLEWCYPDAIPIDSTFTENQYNANCLPHKVDYIFSSHCLEHIEHWTKVLDYWCSNVKDEGIIFLYLPHPSQKYWLPWNNRKHLHALYPEIINEYFKDKGWINMIPQMNKDWFDPNSSFTIISKKP